MEAFASTSFSTNFAGSRIKQAAGCVRILTMPKQVLPQFGEAVTGVLKEHGLSDRAAQYRTGIDRITLADMRNGYQVRMEQVVKFAQGFGLDVNEWLELAGYEPIQSSGSAPTGYHVYARGLHLLEQRTGETQTVSFSTGTPSVEDALAILRQKWERAGLGAEWEQVRAELLEGKG